jgi:hypothetical protein
MSFRAWVNRLLIIFLTLITFVFILVDKKLKLQTDSNSTRNFIPEAGIWSPTNVKLQAVKQTEKLQSFSPSLQTKTVKEQPPLRNNQAAKVPNLPPPSFRLTKAFKEYRIPAYEIALADPSNYGERYTTDINGVPVHNQAIIVLHETGDSASSAINTFQTPHENSDEQVSYHAIIKLDGTVVYTVPPQKRAFGAANSVFDGPSGPETVQTNPNLPPSVNNFAYHVSLETPPEGRNEKPTHVGYTDAQYHSLAWLIAQSQVPEARITTHKAVDRSGQKNDPRSFDFEKFLRLLRLFRQPVAVN